MASPVFARRRQAARPGRAPHRRLRGIEPLETRNLLAVLGLGIELRDNNLDEITTVAPGQEFWVYVLVEDQRAPGEGEPAGVISLPASLSWDDDFIELITEPPSDPPDSDLLTDRFPLQRARDLYSPADGHTGFGDVTSPPTPPVVSADYTPSIANLRGGAIPNAAQGLPIGVPDASVPAGDPDPAVIFSRLHFRANSTITDVQTTLFTIDLAGSMSFADAASLDGVAQLSAALHQQRPGFSPVVDPANPVVDDELRTVTEFFQIDPGDEPGGSSLAGCVFVDANLDGMRNLGPNGKPLEMGLPGITITLTGPVMRTTQTAADGSYRFDDLEPGTYTITETQPPNPPFIDGETLVGTINGMTVGTAGVNTITSIVIPVDGGDGVDYCFSEIPNPDKRYFLASTKMPEFLAEELGVPATTVEGTSGSDNIVVEASLAGMRVTVNGGTEQFYSLDQARVLYVDAKEGNDTVTFVGTAGDEVAQLAPGQGMLRRGNNYVGVNYSIMAIAAEHVIADGNLGDDFAALYDTSADDALVATGNSTKLTNSSNLQTAEALRADRVRAIALERLGNTDDDTSDVDAALGFNLDLAGDWRAI